ncbi:MAG: hypothetical protein GY862_03655 [Gammaproteobacteria bacterium]|nr:hypothetical protein [Gammaproteobacteria bacterium]
MISRSVLVSLPNGDTKEYLTALGIKPNNISSYGKEAPYLETQENGALIEPVSGDFTYAIDFDLFDRGIDSVEKIFVEYSLRGVISAMPDEDNPDPEVYYLWRNGQRLLARIYEDSDTDAFRILDPPGEVKLNWGPLSRKGSLRPLST